MSRRIATPKLVRFVLESNRIEGITDRASAAIAYEAHIALLGLDLLTVPDVEWFVQAIQPGARLRREPGMNVRVGSHVPPMGGPSIEHALEALLQGAKYAHPYVTHRQYESLHPFMDGNGRSGRAIWLWQMLKGTEAKVALQLGFLHMWYYQSLGAPR